MGSRTNSSQGVSALGYIGIGIIVDTLAYVFFA